MGILFLYSQQLTSIIRMNKLILISFCVLTIAALNHATPINIEIADVNGDGLIDRNEFKWAFPDVDLYEEFGKLDTNNDGFIDESDVQNVEQGRGEFFKKITDGVQKFFAKIKDKFGKIKRKFGFF